MSDNCNHSNYDDYFERCEDCGASREAIASACIEFVGIVDGIMTAPMQEHEPDADNASYFYQYYGHAESCELFNDGDCSEDGILWSVGDMGSPYFCTAHYYPQEQLGYEFIEPVKSVLFDDVFDDGEECDDMACTDCRTGREK